MTLNHSPGMDLIACREGERRYAAKKLAGKLKYYIVRHYKCPSCGGKMRASTVYEAFQRDVLQVYCSDCSHINTGVLLQSPKWNKASVKTVMKFVAKDLYGKHQRAIVRRLMD